MNLSIIFIIISRKFEELFPYLFHIILITSGFYILPFVLVDSNIILLVKRAFLLVLMGFICFMIDWRRIRFDSISKACLLWVLLHVIFWLVKCEFFELYILRLSQVAFIWIFVQLLLQRSSYIFTDLVQELLKYIICGLAFILVLLSWNSQVGNAIAGGFGNNRVNFSIWLFQFVFLIHFISILKDQINVRRSFILNMYFSMPIIILQVFLGSRTGLVASILLIVYLAKKAVDLRFAILILAYLCSIVFVFSWVSPIVNNHYGTDILRNISQTSLNYESVDTLLSYRLSITENAVSRIKIESLLYGNGLNNFMGEVIGKYFHVHNIYIRALGEFGILGLFSLAVILFLPYRTYQTSVKKQSAQVFCGIFLMIGLVHPEILVTAINTCLVYWVAYAYVLSPINSSSTQS